MKNVAAEHPDIVKQIEAHMKEAHTPSADWTFAGRKKKQQKKQKLELSQARKSDDLLWVQDSGAATCEIPKSVSPFAKIPAALVTAFSVFLVGAPTLISG